MSHPQYNPFGQGLYGPPSGQPKRDSGMTPSHIGSGPVFSSSGAASVTSANPTTKIPSLMAQVVAFRPDQTRPKAERNQEKPVVTHDNRPREDARFLGNPDHQSIGQNPHFPSTQRDEYLPSGPELTSYAMSTRRPEVNSGSGSMDWLASLKTAPPPPNLTKSDDGRFNPPSDRNRSMQSIPGIGDYGYTIPDSAEKAQPKYSSESAANILLHFGLEKEDLEYLVSFSEKQMTPSNLPFILRQINIEKAKRSAAATVQSKPYTELQPIQPARGTDSFSSPAGSSAVIQPAQVIDYGHTSKYVSEVGRTGSQSCFSMGGNVGTLLDTYERTSHNQQLLPKNVTDLNSGSLGPVHNRGGPLASSTSPYVSFSNDLTKRSTQSNTTPKTPLSPFVLPETDTDRRILTKTFPSKELDVDRQLASETKSPCMPPYRGVHSDRPGLAVVGRIDNDGTKTNQGTRHAGLAVADQMKMWPMQQNQQGQQIQPRQFQQNQQGKQNQPRQFHKNESGQQNQPRQFQQAQQNQPRQFQQNQQGQQNQTRQFQQNQPGQQNQPRKFQQVQQNQPRNFQQNPEVQQNQQLERRQNQQGQKKKQNQQRQGEQNQQRQPQQNPLAQQNQQRQMQQNLEVPQKGKVLPPPLLPAAQLRSPAQQSSGFYHCSTTIPSSAPDSGPANTLQSLAPSSKPVRTNTQKRSSKTSDSTSLPRLSVMHDYAALTPRVFPHTCSLCLKQSLSLKSWISHQNSKGHIESCKSLRESYPDWNGEVVPEKSATEEDAKPSSSAPGRSSQQQRRKSRSPSPRKRENRSRSRSPHSSRYTQRSRSRSQERPRRKDETRCSPRRSDDKRSSPRRKDDKDDSSRHTQRSRSRSQERPRRKDETRCSPRRSDDKRSSPRRKDDKDDSSRHTQRSHSRSQERPRRKGETRSSPRRSDDKRSSPRRKDDKDDSSRHTQRSRSRSQERPRRKDETRSSPRRSDDKRSSSRRKDDKDDSSRHTRRSRSRSQERPRRKDETRCSPRRSDDKRSSPRRKDDKKFSPRKSDKRSSSTRSDDELPSPRRSNRKGSSPRRSQGRQSSPQRKSASSAEQLVQELLAKTASESKSGEPDLEAVVKTLAPALLAELTKMKSSLSSSSSPKGERGSQSSSSADKTSSSSSSSKSSSTAKSKETPRAKSDKHDHSTTVKLRGVPQSLHYNELVSAMESFGKTKKVVIYRSTAEANVFFEKEEDVDKLRSLNEINIKGLPLAVFVEMDTGSEKKIPQKKPASSSISPSTKSTTKPTSKTTPREKKTSSSTSGDQTEKGSPIKAVTAAKASEPGFAKPEVLQEQVKQTTKSVQDTAKRVTKGEVEETSSPQERNTPVKSLSSADATKQERTEENKVSLTSENPPDANTCKSEEQDTKVKQPLNVESGDEMAPGLKQASVPLNHKGTNDSESVMHKEVGPVQATAEGAPESEGGVPKCDHQVAEDRALTIVTSETKIEMPSGMPPPAQGQGPEPSQDQKDHLENTRVAKIIMAGDVGDHGQAVDSSDVQTDKSDICENLENFQMLDSFEDVNTCSEESSEKEPGTSSKVKGPKSLSSTDQQESQDAGKKSDEKHEDASRAVDTGMKRASRGKGAETKSKQDLKVEGLCKKKPTECLRTPKDNQKREVQRDAANDQDDDILDLDAFEILDSIDATEDDMEVMPEEPSRLKDDEADNKETRTEEPKGKAPRTRASKRKQSPKKQDRTVKKIETQTKATAGVLNKDQKSKEFPEEMVFKVLDSVEGETSTSERPGRRRSARGKKEELGEAPAKSGDDKEPSYKILDSVEDEAAEEELATVTRSTRGRRGRTSKKEASVDRAKKEDASPRKSSSPARESTKKEEAHEESTPTKKLLVTLVDVGDIKGEADKTSKSFKRKHEVEPAAEVMDSFVTVDEVVGAEEEDGIQKETCKARGQGRKRSRRTPVRKSSRGKTSEGELEEQETCSVEAPPSPASSEFLKEKKQQEIQKMEVEEAGEASVDVSSAGEKPQPEMQKLELEETGEANVDFSSAGEEPQPEKQKVEVEGAAEALLDVASPVPAQPPLDTLSSLGKDPSLLPSESQQELQNVEEDGKGGAGVEVPSLAAAQPSLDKEPPSLPAGFEQEKQMIEKQGAGEASVDVSAAGEEPQPESQRVEEEGAGEANVDLSSPREEQQFGKQKVKEEGAGEASVDVSSSGEEQQPEKQKVKEEAAGEVSVDVSPAGEEQQPQKQKVKEEEAGEACVDRSSSAAEPQPEKQRVKEEGAGEVSVDVSSAGEEQHPEKKVKEEGAGEASVDVSSAAEEPQLEQHTVKDEAEASVDFSSPAEEPQPEQHKVEEEAGKASVDVSSAAEEPQLEQQKVEEAAGEASVDVSSAAEEPQPEEQKVEKDGAGEASINVTSASGEPQPEIQKMEVAGAGEASVAAASPVPGETPLDTPSSLEKGPPLLPSKNQPEIQKIEMKAAGDDNIDVSSAGGQPQPEKQKVEGREEETNKQAKTKRKTCVERVEAKRPRSDSPCVAVDFKLPRFTPNNPLGQEFVVPKSGFFCNLCRVFYLSESVAKEQHCSSKKHYDLLQKHYQKL